MHITYMTVSLPVSIGGTTMRVSALREGPGGETEGTVLASLPLTHQHCGADAQELLMLLSEELYHLSTNYEGPW